MGSPSVIPRVVPPAATTGDTTRPQLSPPPPLGEQRAPRIAVPFWSASQRALGT
jgi:hypothetical protein